MASNVPEEGYEEWSSSSTYASGAQVLVSLDATGAGERTPHMVYQSLQDGNSGLYPPDNPASWMEVGSTNRWAMFDQYASTKTVCSEQINVRLGSGWCDVLGLFRLESASLTVSVYDGDTAVFVQELDLRETDVLSSWYDYFFCEFSYRQDILVDLPLLSEAQVEVVISNPGGQAACGLAVVGKGHYIGETQFDLKLGLLDYSRTDTDDFGRTYLAQGNCAKSLDLDLEVDTVNLDRIRRKLAGLRGQPAIWDGNNDGCSYESLMVYGFLRQFEVSVQGPVDSVCNLDIEGLI